MASRLANHLVNLLATAIIAFERPDMMSKKWVSRLAILGVAGLFLWIIGLMTRSPQLVIAENREPNEQMMVGEVMEITSYDIHGNPEAQVKARVGKQLSESEWQLTESDAELIQADGSVMRFFADHFRQETSGARVVEANPGSRILLQDDSGLEIESGGPIRITGDDRVSTEAAARFKWREAWGRCEGLEYRVGKLLELGHDATFNAQLVDGVLQFRSDGLRFDLATGTGSVRQGYFVATGLDQGHASLYADRMQFTYSGLSEDDFFRFGELIGKSRPDGQSTRVTWERGDILSERFHACFDEQNGQLVEVTSGDDANFSTETEDGYSLLGRSGQLVLSFAQGEPQRLVTSRPVGFEGVAADGARFSLSGEQGFDSILNGGRASSTVVYGSPVFQINRQHGRAGSVRLLHSEGRILLGGGAVLQDLDQRIEVKGEEILLANWEGDQREVFAREFVELLFEGKHGQTVEGFGDQLKMTFADQTIDLRGRPAQFRSGGGLILANQVTAVGQSGGRFILSAKGDLDLKVDLEDGSAYRLQGQQMRWHQFEGRIEVESVESASLHRLGEVSAERMVILLEHNGGESIKSLQAEGQVVFEGAIERDGELERFSCLADVLRFNQASQELKLEGLDTDVVVNFRDGQSHKVRELTYNLKDGSMLAGSDTHGFTRTILNLKDPQKEPSPDEP